MPATPRPRRRPDDRGNTSAAVLLTVSLATVAFVAFVNVLTYQIGRSAVRSAVDQAAHAGSRASGGTTACQRRAHQALDTVLGGPLGDDVTIACTTDGDTITATATGTFHGWLDIVPDWSWTIAATATREGQP